MNFVPFIRKLLTTLKNMDSPQTIKDRTAAKNTLKELKLSTLR
jgi:hypothetical protein